jgi:two-component system, LytTR family, sensor histidine kinase AlgZ
VPPLVLLPLAENAVKHGPAAGHAGEISLRATAEGGRLRVALANPGRYAGPRPGSDGLPTVERRLALAYGGRARLSITAEGERTVAVLDLPDEVG